MGDCAVTAVVTLRGNVTAQAVLRNNITASVSPSQVRAAEICMRLAANDNNIGEQLLANIVGGSVMIVALPLLGSVPAGKVQTFIVTLVKKTHTTPPSYIEIELLDDDAPSVSAPNEVLQPYPGGNSTIFQAAGDPSTSGGRGVVPPTTTTFAQFAQIEPLINASRVSERVFHPKGTSNTIGIAINIVGGTGVDYDFLVQVLGEKMAV